MLLGCSWRFHSIQAVARWRKPKRIIDPSSLIPLSLNFVSAWTQDVPYWSQTVLPGPSTARCMRSMCSCQAIFPPFETSATTSKSPGSYRSLITVTRFMSLSKVQKNASSFLFNLLRNTGMILSYLLSFQKNIGLTLIHYLNLKYTKPGCCMKSPAESLMKKQDSKLVPYD